MVIFWALVMLSTTGASNISFEKWKDLEFMEHFMISNADATVFFLMWSYLARHPLTMGDFIFPLRPSFKLGFRPKSKLDSKIRFYTNAQINFGFRLSLKLGLKLG